jgi:hypothetical protein
MEVQYFFEKTVNFYRTARRHTLEEGKKFPLYRIVNILSVKERVRAGQDFEEKNKSHLAKE